MAEQPPIKAETLYDLLNHEFPPNAAWIEPELLPKGGTLMLGGQAKVGKSLLMEEFARSLITATPLFEHPDLIVPAKAHVTLVEKEIGPRSLQKRSAKIFSNVPEADQKAFFTWFSKNEGGGSLLHFDSRNTLPYWERVIKQLGTNVLILDPISFMHSYEENDNSDISQLFRTLELLKFWGRENEMSIIMSHHYGKPPYGDAAKNWDPLASYNLRGSSKWKDAPDTLFTCHRAAELPKPYEAWKLNCRWLTRHGSSPPEMTLHVNEEDDLRVRWKRDKEPLATFKEVPKKALKLGTQEKLYEATAAQK